MKNSILTFVFLLTPVFLFAQSFTSGSNPHDSLLFDGGDASPLNFSKEADGECKIKVQDVFGEAIGTYLDDTLVTIGECGFILGKKMKTVRREGRQLKRGVTLVEGYEITTGGEGYKAPSGNIHSNLLMLDLGPTALIVGRRASLTIGKDCIIHVKQGAVEAAGEIDISTPRGVVRHKKTKFSVDVGENEDIIRVYEGSVEFELKKVDDSKVKSGGDEMQKLNEDYQSGKISLEEYTKRVKELSETLGKDILDASKVSVVIEAGYQCTVGKKFGDVIPIENDDRWWDNLEK